MIITLKHPSEKTRQVSRDYDDWRDLKLSELKARIEDVVNSGGGQCTFFFNDDDVFELEHLNNFIKSIVPYKVYIRNELKVREGRQ